MPCMDPMGMIYQTLHSLEAVGRKACRLLVLVQVGHVLGS